MQPVRRPRNAFELQPAGESVGKIDLKNLSAGQRQDADTVLLWDEVKRPAVSQADPPSPALPADKGLH